MARQKPTEAEIVAEFWKLNSRAEDDGDEYAGAARDALSWVLGDAGPISEGYE
jgi:hypothetical protein